MAPAVPERSELRLSLPRMKRDRQLANLEASPGSPDHHLRRELHPGRLQSEHRKHVAPERAHPAMGVANRCPEEQVEKAREKRISDTTQRRHSPRVNRLH